MPITFSNKKEVNEYIKWKASEGFKCKIQKKGNSKFLVNIIGKIENTNIQETYQESMEKPIVRIGLMPSNNEVNNTIATSVKNAINNSKGNIGMLLSGGMDSVMLLEFVVRHGKVVPVFTVVTDSDHPDLIAAKKIAKEYGLEHHILLPNKDDMERAKKALGTKRKLFKGDIAVYLALELAKNKGVDTILTADGIDEITGGYWWHAHPSNNYANKEEAFQDYWNKLNDNHVKPLLDSAKKVGIEVKLPFLDEEVVSVLNRIPIKERVKNNITKNWWKQFASSYIPQYIIDRKKIGFVDALDEENIMKEKK